MICNKFKTPVGFFRIYKNFKTCLFNIEANKDNTFWIDGKELHSDGNYKISLDLSLFSVGDIISCELDNGVMLENGGDENTLNIVGEIGEYIIGVGAPDSSSIEEAFFESKLPEDMNKTKYALPYDTIEITNRGYIFKIKDNPLKYNDRNYSKYIELCLVWKDKNEEFAFDIVSGLTC